MALVVAILTFEMSIIIVREVFQNNEDPGIIIDTYEVIKIFGFFINVLIWFRVIWNG